jgi:hypothetical protein
MLTTLLAVRFSLASLPCSFLAFGPTAQRRNFKTLATSETSLWEGRNVFNNAPKHPACFAFELYAFGLASLLFSLSQQSCPHTSVFLTLRTDLALGETTP